MKKTSLILFVIAIFAVDGYLFSVAKARAQTDASGTPLILPEMAPTSTTAQEEVRGSGIWSDLQAKKTSCQDLTEADYASLGEYFMGQRLGGSHEAMDQMMKSMMGDAGESRMHAALGQRLSGCIANVVYPASGSQFLPMMGMMGDYWNTAGFNANVPNYNTMMNYDYQGLGFFGPFFMILFWAVVILGIIAIVRWSMGQSRSVDKADSRKEKMPMEILKERYAKGEIDKKEFEEIKKNLV